MDKPIERTAILVCLLVDRERDWCTCSPRTCRAIGRAGASRVSRKGTLHRLKNHVNMSTICMHTYKILWVRQPSIGQEQRANTVTGYFAKLVSPPNHYTYRPAHVCGRSWEHDQRFPPLLLVVLSLHTTGLHHLRVVDATMQ